MNPIDRIPAHTSPFDGIRRVNNDGSEWWSARDLMPLLGYDRWERFADAIERARIAAENSGVSADQTASRLREPVATRGNTPDTERVNYRLTRYGAYLVAMNADPRKAKVAEAQTYFAVKTREAEIGKRLTRLELIDLARESELARIEEERARLAAEAKVAELAPPAKAWEAISASKGDFLVEDAAKMLSRDPNIFLGRGRLFALLSEYGWIFRQRGDGRWRAYQSAVDAGRLTERLSDRDGTRTGERVFNAPQVRVTAKGLLELHRRLDGVAPLHLQFPLFGIDGGAA